MKLESYFKKFAKVLLVILLVLAANFVTSQKNSVHADPACSITKDNARQGDSFDVYATGLAASAYPVQIATIGSNSISLGQITLVANSNPPVLAGTFRIPDDAAETNYQVQILILDTSGNPVWFGCTPNITVSALPPIPSPKLPVSDFSGFRPESFVGNLVTAILPIVLGIAGFLTVIFIVISGIQFVTSSGNPEAAAAARSRLIFALVGFVIIVLAFAITQIVDRVFLGDSGIFQ